MDLKVTLGHINGYLRLDIVSPITKVIKTWKNILNKGEKRRQKLVLVPISKGERNKN